MNTREPCGSELARDEAVTSNITASRPTAIASKLSSHRGFVVDAGAMNTRAPLWELSLLAKGPAGHAQNQQAKTGATEVAPVVLPVEARIFVGPRNHR